MIDDGLKCRQCNGYLKPFTTKSLTTYSCPECGRVCRINIQRILAVSPEKIQERITEAELKITETTGAIRGAEARLEELKAKYDKLQGAGEEAQIAADIKSITKEIKDLRKKLDTKMLDMYADEDEVEVIELAKNINRQSAELFKLKDWSKQLKTVSNEIAKVEKELERLKRELKRRYDEKGTLEGQLHGLEEAERAVREKHIAKKTPGDITEKSPYDEDLE